MTVFISNNDPQDEMRMDGESKSVDISCGGCGASLHVFAHHRTTQCPFCASPNVIERPHETSPDPTFVIGFVINQRRAAELVQDWMKSAGLFARSDFKDAAAELTRGVYLPAYLYGAVADSDYVVEIGENYTVTESYTSTNSQGRTVRRTRRKTKTEWRPLEGSHSCYIDDVIVSASRVVKNSSLEAIEPFDLRALRRYTPTMVSGWIAANPSRTQDQCFHLAHQESMRIVEKKLQQFMPGDRYRDLKYHTHFSNQIIDFVLLPVWSFAVKYHSEKPEVSILVNGQTGKVSGRIPTSGFKVTIAAVVALLLVAIFALVFAYL